MNLQLILEIIEGIKLVNCVKILVVCLHTFHREWKCFEHMLYKDSRTVSALFLEGFKIAIPGKLVNGCILVELLTLTQIKSFPLFNYSVVTHVL